MLEPSERRVVFLQHLWSWLRRCAAPYVESCHRVIESVIRRICVLSISLSFSRVVFSDLEDDIWLEVVVEGSSGGGI